MDLLPPRENPEPEAAETELRIQQAARDLQSLPVPTLVPWSTRLTWQLRLKFFLTGVLFPVLCLITIGAGSQSSVDSPWQSGHLQHYVVVLTSRPTIFVFAPLLLFSFVCLGRWCIWPHKCNSLLNWMGLISGVVLALTFTILLIITTAIFGQIMALFVAPCLALLVYLLGLSIEKRLFRGQFSIKYLLVLTTVIALVFALWTALGLDALSVLSGLFGYLAVGFLFVIGGASTLGLITFCRVSVASAYLIQQKGRQPSFSSKLISACVAWLAGFAVTWKFAIDVMMWEYAKLPTTDPNCYVSSAAANGHPGFVGSFEVSRLNSTDSSSDWNRCLDENVATINRQMQRLKFLEFAFAAILPSLHRVVRSFYNNVGPRLAKSCQASIWFSDLTYVLLKPLEWTAVLIRTITGVSQQSVDRIYRR